MSKMSVLVYNIFGTIPKSLTIEEMKKLISDFTGKVYLTYIDIENEDIYIKEKFGEFDSSFDVARIRNHKICSFISSDDELYQPSKSLINFISKFSNTYISYDEEKLFKPTPYLEYPDNYFKFYSFTLTDGGKKIMDMCVEDGIITYYNNDGSIKRIEKIDGKIIRDKWGRIVKIIGIEYPSREFQFNRTPYIKYLDDNDNQYIDTGVKPE